MGLAMVHGIVHDHGGHVGVQTRLGAGTCFSVLLPPCADQPASALPAPVGGTTDVKLRATVLVVDDERMVGAFLEELLQGWGLEVVLHHDPLQAQAWLEDEAHAVDLLITDQTMPQRSGLELARHVRRRRPQLPVLLVSGNAQAFDDAELDDHGIAAMLTKPIDTARLREVLRGLLSRASRA
jgi:CheY-like chemotaxis protein